MSRHTWMIVLWLVLCAPLISCSSTVEPVLAGTWGVCSDGTDDEKRIVFGVAYDEVFRFNEDGTFLVYAESAFRSEGAVAQASGEYKVLSVNSTATSASGEMQLLLTAPAPITVHVPFTYLPKSSHSIGYLMLTPDGDYLPCQPCGLCQLQAVTIRAANHYQ